MGLIVHSGVQANTLWVAKLAAIKPDGASPIRSANTVLCEYCYAWPGERCVTKSGRAASYWHEVRIDVARGYRAATFIIREHP